MTIIISLLLLVSLLPNPTFTAHVSIVNGREAKPHSRPYMVSLWSDGNYKCSGFLISVEFVLTAAQCWKQGEALTVVVGAYDLSKRTICDHYEVESYIPHPDYRPCLLLNDIMLLKLKKRVKLNHNVGLISLPNAGKEAKVGCSVVGWGSLGTKGPVDNRLMEANTTIVKDARCEHKWRSTYNASQMICSYNHGGPCKGDSGGPVVCGKKPTAVGIASFGDPCNFCSRNYINAYTKIEAFHPWIKKEIGKSACRSIGRAWR